MPWMTNCNLRRLARIASSAACPTFGFPRVAACPAWQGLWMLAGLPAISARVACVARLCCCRFLGHSCLSCIPNFCTVTAPAFPLVLVVVLQVSRALLLVVPTDVPGIPGHSARPANVASRFVFVTFAAAHSGVLGCLPTRSKPR